MSHDLITQTTRASHAAVMLYAVLVDQRPNERGEVRISQHSLSTLCGWGCTKSVQRAADTLEDIGWLHMRHQFGRRSCHRYTPRPLPRTSQGDAVRFERLPRTVLDTLTRHEDGARLLHVYLQWCLTANQDTGRGWTTITAAQFARTFRYRKNSVERDREALVELGLLLTHTATDGKITTRPVRPGEPIRPATDIARSVRISPADPPSEVSVGAVPICPPVFRPLLDQPLNQDSAATLDDQVTAGDNTTAHAPKTTNDDVTEQPAPKPHQRRRSGRSRDHFAKAARRFIATCPQTAGLNPVARGMLAQALAKQLRSLPDQPIAQTLELLAFELDLAADLHAGRYFRHSLVITQLFDRLRLDARLAATTTEAAAELVDESGLPDWHTRGEGLTGPDLETLAISTPPAAETAQASPDQLLQACTIAMARTLLDELETDPGVNVEDALDTARSRARVLLQLTPAQGWALIAARHQVRDAYRVSWRRDHDAGLFDDHVDADEILAAQRAAQECLSRLATAA